MCLSETSGSLDLKPLSFQSLELKRPAALLGPTTAPPIFPVTLDLPKSMENKNSFLISLFDEVPGEDSTSPWLLGR